MKALYDHTIELIELTKLLERDVCDTMTVTNSLYRDYAVGVKSCDCHDLFRTR